MSEAFQCDRCKGYFDEKCRTELKVEDGKFVMLFGFVHPLSEEELAVYQERQESNPVSRLFGGDSPKYAHQDLCEPCQKELIYLGLMDIIKESKQVKGSDKWDNVLKDIQK